MLGKVLILEDEAVVALAIEACLAGEGHRVLAVASTASEAVAMASEERPDLLMADISIAGRVDGIEAALMVRQISGADVVFLTAHRDAAIRARAEAAAPLGYLLKPFRERELAAAVEIALCRRAARCHAAEPRLPFEVDAASGLTVLSAHDEVCPLASHCVAVE